MATVIGIDIGQKRDSTAIAVAELECRTLEGGRREDHWLVRHLERCPSARPTCGWPTGSRGLRKA